MLPRHLAWLGASLALVSLLAVSASPALARAPTARPAPPSSASASDEATATFRGESLALVIGYHSGRGVLTFQGHRYNFVLSGYSALGLGAERVVGTAQIRHLTSIDDFPGLYGATGASGVFIVGDGHVVLRNAKGVEIVLRTENRGLQLNLAAGGVRVDLR